MSNLLFDDNCIDYQTDITDDSYNDIEHDFVNTFNDSSKIYLINNNNNFNYDYLVDELDSIYKDYLEDYDIMKNLSYSYNKKSETLKKEFINLIFNMDLESSFFEVLLNKIINFQENNINSFIYNQILLRKNEKNIYSIIYEIPGIFYKLSLNISKHNDDIILDLKKLGGKLDELENKIYLREITYYFE